jgi:hypothetical protein
VLAQQRHQLLALAGLAPATLGVLLEPRILAHLRRAAGARTSVAHRRTTGTTGTRAAIRERRTRATRAPIRERRARTTRTPIAKRRARAGRPIAERWARAWRRARHRRRHPFERRAVTTTVRPPEPLAARCATAAVTTAALATTRTPATGATAATATARPDWHVAASPVVVVHAATVHALASATALAVAVWAHLDHHRRPFVVKRRCRGWGDSELLEIREFLQQRFLQTLSHPFSYCARAVPTFRARSR